MTPDPPIFDQTLFDAETARFRKVLAKGRSANQLALFDFLVERTGDDRSPKEIEIALALFGEGATQDSSGDSGARVYVHRLRKRMDDYYSGKSGLRLGIPTGEYRIVLTGKGQRGEAQNRFQPLRDTIAARPVQSIGLGLALAAALVLIGWIAAPTQPGPSTPPTQQVEPLPGALAGASSPLIVVGDSLLVAESEDQRSVQRMILDPQIGSRDDLGQYLKTHPEAFYRLYDFNLNYAPIGTIEAAWRVQAELDSANGSDGETRTFLPVSSLGTETLRSHDLLYVGRLAQLGVLKSRVFAGSRYRLSSYNQLTDINSGRTYTGQVYSDVQDAPRLDYGYIAVKTGPEGQTITVLAGLGDQGTLAMAELLSGPRDLTHLKARLGESAKFEALFEVRTSESSTLDRRLVALSPLR